MRKIREVLRLRQLGLSERGIARSLGIGLGTVVKYLVRAQGAGLAWPLGEEWDDGALEAALFPRKPEARPERPVPDWSWVHLELRKRHVTLSLLWEEYKAEHPEGYQYTQFCHHYRRWAGQLKVWMRQPHRGGEKLFVDWAGRTIPWYDRQTGQERQAPLFVATLGASSKTFARATESQKLHEWLDCHVRAFRYIGGVTAVVVPDQPRTAVKTPCWYEPELNPSYADLARHYNTCIIPARPRRPRDKAKAEGGVLLVERWIVAALRDRHFYGVGEINEAVEELLDKLNHRKMRKLGRSREELFLELDRPNLRPLPQKAYEFAEWKIGLRVGLDYHVTFDGNHYSVDYHQIHEYVDVRATRMAVEIFLRHRRIASHVRLHGKHGYSTCREHMPRSHQMHAEWTPARIIRWAETVGPWTSQMVQSILTHRPHPEQGYRACLGILRLAKRDGNDRLEKACQRAVACQMFSYRSVDSILKRKLEDQPLPEPGPDALPPHENVRGGAYFD